METIYFSNWMVPVFTGVELFFFFTLVIVFFAFLKMRPLDSKSLQTLRKNMGIESEVTDSEIIKQSENSSLSKKWPYMLGALTFVGWFIYPSLFGVYLVQKQSDGTLILKNCYHITLGTIQKNEKITLVEYQKILLRGRSAYSAVIHTEKQTYKTVSNSMDVISAGIKEIQK